MDRLSELKAFLAVVETGGFTAAARRTGTSQPAVSKAIGALENRLGVALFNRSTRNVTLTDQGQRYFDRMKPLLEEIDDANREVIGSAVDMSGSIRIAVPTTLGRLHILPIIPDLLSRFPELEVDLVLSDLMRDMVEDRVDLVIRVGSVEEPDAVVRRVAKTPLVCVGSRQYFEKHGIPTKPAELADHNCLVYGGFRGVGELAIRRSRRSLQRRSARQPHLQQHRDDPCGCACRRRDRHVHQGIARRRALAS